MALHDDLEGAPSSPLLQVLRQEHHEIASQSSEVLEVMDMSTNKTFRNVHLVSFQPITKALLSATEKAAERYIGMFQLTYEAAGYMAALHFNRRNSSIVPDLAERVADQCPDLRISYEMSDTQVNRLIALKTLQKVSTRPDLPLYTPLNASQFQPRPTAIIGGAASSVSKALANLAGIYLIPQISGTSSATALEDKLAAPYFSRTYPTNQADAEALMIFYKSIGVTHFGLIYSQDLYGQGYGQAVVRAAARHQIEVYFTAYEIVKDGFQPLKEGLQYLVSTQVRYFFAVLHYESYKAAFQEGYNLGIMGHAGYTWILSDNNVEITTDDFTLDASTERDIARAIHGVGVLLPGIETHPVIASIMEEEFKTDTQLQRNFVAAHQSHLWHYFEDVHFANTSMLPSFYAGMVYDAAMTACLAACSIQDDKFFTSEQLLNAMRQQTFQGATGYVTFNNYTGTRDLLGLRYTITNVLIAEEHQQLTPGQISFNSTRRVAMEFPSDVVDLGQGPFIYSDGTSNPPDALPPIELDMHLIPTGVQAFGCALAVNIMLLSVACIVFAYRFRHKQAIRAAQPPFLYMICCGCIMMASAIIPMSFQEPISKFFLDGACMSYLYQMCIGFCMSFSALFCKLYRINQLMQGAKHFRRVQVNVRDVLNPLFIMVSLNLIILIAWSIVDPLTWKREPTEHSQDVFGRETSSSARCSSQNWLSEVIFGGCLFAVNVVALVLANIEGYRGRHLPSQFNETGRIVMCMFFLLEAGLVMMPTYLAVQHEPTGAFVVKSLLIFFCCAAILGPMFLPLWSERRGLNQKQRARSVFISRRSRPSTLATASTITGAVWKHGHHSSRLLTNGSYHSNHPSMPFATTSTVDRLSVSQPCHVSTRIDEEESTHSAPCHRRRRQVSLAMDDDESMREVPEESTRVRPRKVSFQSARSLQPGTTKSEKSKEDGSKDRKPRVSFQPTTKTQSEPAEPSQAEGCNETKLEQSSDDILPFDEEAVFRPDDSMPALAAMPVAEVEMTTTTTITSSHSEPKGAPLAADDDSEPKDGPDDDDPEPFQDEIDGLTTATDYPIFSPRQPRDWSRYLRRSQLTASPIRFLFPQHSSKTEEQQEDSKHSRTDFEGLQEDWSQYLVRGQHLREWS